MLKTAPNPVDVQDLQFKLKCRLKVFDKAENDNFSQHCGLITCASRFGLIFVGTNTSSFQVIQLKHLEEYTKNDGDKSDYPRRNITLPSPPKYLSTNCEHTILAVVIEKDGCPCALFYDVKSFWQQNIVQLEELRLSPTPGVYIVDINWNPALASIFTACKSDGTLGVYELKNPGIDINELPAASGATCFCWSPKGKQIAVGSRDGKITQYKPDLKAVKVINAPPLKEPHSLISLQWVSNYQFIGVFHPIGPNNQSTLLVIDAPKTGDSTFMNYDDICYSNGNTRASQFYMILQQNWNILMVASSNSMEVGILGNSGECWTQWTMGDAARAELPLSHDRQETLPIGLALDIGSTKPVPWGESVLPPAPILLLFSHYGTLCCFNVINLKEGIPTICTPPDQLTDTSGLQYFINKIESGPVKEVAQVQSPSLLKPAQQTKNPSLFGIVNSPLQTDLSKPQGLNFSTIQHGPLFQVQAASTSVTQANKSTSLFSSTTYQPMYPSLQNTESKSTSSNVISQVTNTSSPFTSKAVVTTIPPSVHLNIPKPNQSIPIKTSEELNKTDITANDSLKVEEEAEALFAQMVKEECIFLESELKAILDQGRSLKLNLGTSDDKTRIVQTTKSLEDFFKEVVETCKVQNAEVHILKQNLLQSWAWYEEVKSLHMASKDESMAVILRAQPLDSVSEKQLEDIRHANYYLESQIAQAHRALDEQWENFQDYCKKTYKMKIPTMEVIFQTMVKQNAILAKQNFILKDIASRIKSKSRSSIGPSLLLSMNNIEDLSDELKKLRMNPEDICQIQYEHAESRRKNLTKAKVDNLKSFLTKRKPSRISVIKPQFSTSIIQPSPAKLKQLSKSEVRVPLITKENAVRKIDFVQSTPKPSVVKSEPLEEASTTTPIEGLQNFALKFEAKNFNKVPEKSFTPFSKSVISGSPNSAFVSTSFAGMSTSTPVSATFKPVSFGHGSTNVSTVGKTLPSFVVVTTVPSSNQPVITISAGNVPKAFSFANASGGSLSLQNSTKNTPASLANTTNTNAVSSSGAKPSFAFYLQTTAKTSTPATTTSKKPIFVVTTVKSSTPATSAFTLATPPKSTIAVGDNSNTAPAKQNYIFGTQAITSSAASFSLSKSNTTNIFKYTSQKSGDSPTTSVATSKPFVFSSVAATKTTVGNTNVVATTPPPSTAIATITPIPNPVVASNVSTSPAQPVSFAVSTPNVDFPKPVSSVQQLMSSTTPSVTITPKVVTPITSVTPVSTQSSIFGTPASTKPSLFGTFTSPTTTQTSIFGSVVTTTSTQSSIFPVGINKPSIFGTPPSQVVSSTPTVTTSVATTTTSTGTIPTGVITATSTVPAATTTSSVTSTAVNSATMGVVFDAQPSTTQQPPQSPTFAPVSSTTGFTFGVAPSTKPSIFGSGNGVSTSKPSLFGTVPASTTSSSIFGVVTTTTSQSFDSNATPAPIFGTVTTSASSQSSIFGAAPATTTTQSQGFGLFGSTAQKSSIFGSTPSTTQSSIFGSTSQPTLFGATTITTSNSTFGQNQSLFDPPKSTPSVFGQSSVFSSSSNTFGSASVFGNSPSTFGQSTGSIFGNPPATTSGGIFGGGTPTTSSVFGSSAPVFGNPVSTASSPFGSGSVFSPTSSSSTGTFGFGTLNVGSTATTSNTGFGVTPTSNPFGSDNKSIFGSPAATSASSVFGSTNTGSIFGNSSQTFGSGFGSSQPVFGQQTTFGQSTFGSSTFGQQTSGPFSAGSGSVAQSGFGAGPSFQKSSGFGSSPVFGSGPAFGSAPSFGGAPAFGSPPTFSSPSKIFGAGSPTFGATGAAQNTAFGNLANQPTVGFGNLAQQASNTTPNAPFSGSSSFSSWR